MRDVQSFMFDVFWVVGGGGGRRGKAVVGLIFCASDDAFNECAVRYGVTCIH